MELIKEKQKKTFEVLKGDFGYTSSMQAPRLEKVVVSTGTGSIKDSQKIDIIKEGLAKITGQKAAARKAKQSIATFKTREGDIVGYQVTLRGPRMYDFVDRLINVALPRTKDFKGVPATAIDDMGNMTVGIKEHTIFPETPDEDIKNVFGLAITLVTSAGSKKEAQAFFRHIGVPFKKEKK